MVSLLDRASVGVRNMAQDHYEGGSAVEQESSREAAGENADRAMSVDKLGGWTRESPAEAAVFDLKVEL
jgi:hypothetical protein